MNEELPPCTVYCDQEDIKAYCDSPVGRQITVGNRRFMVWLTVEQARSLQGQLVDAIKIAEELKSK